MPGADKQFVCEATLTDLATNQVVFSPTLQVLAGKSNVASSGGEKGARDYLLSVSIEGEAKEARYTLEVHDGETSRRFGEGVRQAALNPASGGEVGPCSTGEAFSAPVRRRSRRRWRVSVGVLLAEHAAAAEVKTGGIRMLPVDGKYKVWTKKVGRGPIKLLTLHGGPGCTHEYFECFEDFLPQAGRRVLLLRPARLGLLRPARRPEPLDGRPVSRGGRAGATRAWVSTNFYLLGHSWGGMLAIEYALKYPQHLKGLVISDMTASIPSYMEYAAKLRAALPKDVVAVLDKYEAKGEYDAPEYQEAMIEKVYREHLCRLDPWPDPVERTLQAPRGARLQHDAGPERVRRHRATSRTGTAGTTCRRSAFRRS